MYICPQCSAENRAAAHFCRECGVRRKMADVEQKIEEGQCPCCAKKVRHSDKYCINCGEKLHDRQTADTKLCLSCKVLVPRAANFCMNCGEYVAEKSTRKVDLTSDVFADDNPDTPRFEA